MSLDQQLLPAQQYIDKQKVYRVIKFHGEHDTNSQLLENVMKYNCLEGIELLFKDPEAQKHLNCTYRQMCRRAAYFAQRHVSDDLLIAQLVVKHQLIVSIKKDPQTGILLSMGVANPIFLKMFANELNVTQFSTQPSYFQYLIIQKYNH
ncbi:Hypothetical_protein [Hexamita inflata]|uniref:Hypothetical_protein n=1 Tax=Hexamita inflata TaxID=28002 RepID=A0AA86TWW7_9EUKA|nr:Hypothetical protein HINF_LOCUS19589 [Hexamita inflata]CAI9933302.1 Hypothetical protein HINF_LOCUS20947 [Hexamita inflata]